MLVGRNLMAHTCDFAGFEAVIAQISSRCLAVLGDLYRRLGVELLEL